MTHVGPAELNGHAKPPGRRTRILVISPSPPWPADSGGAQRTALLLEALAREGQVDLCLLGSQAALRSPEETARYEAIDLPCVRSSRLRQTILFLLAWIAPELALALPDNGRARQLAKLTSEGDYDIVVMRYGVTACRLKRLPQLAPGPRYVVDVDDFLAQLLRFAGSGTGRHRLRRLLMSLARPIMERREREALLHADGLWVTGWRPRWLDRYEGLVVDLPNIPWNRGGKRHSPDGEAADLIGVAQFSYGPNRDGFDWFVRAVWPLIRATRPGATIKLVGNLPPKSDLASWTSIPGVRLTGKVPDVTEEYGLARVAIAPIFRGGGTKIKVLEAFQMGLPCVCSSHAASALPELDSLLVADQPRAFADHCLSLIDDADQRARLAQRGRHRVRRYYSRAIFTDRVKSLVRQVVQRS
jgi:polysaccharide biosynthesis protein PslH